MQLVIKDGRVIAWHKDEQDIFDAYPKSEYTIVQWDGPESDFSPDPDTNEAPIDPRTLTQKTIDTKLHYLQERLQAYPSVRECLAMIFRDMRDGTKGYVEVIQAINEHFPQPKIETGDCDVQLQ